MSRFKRILKHWWWDSKDAQRALNPEAAQRIQQHVAQSEQAHSGEIRVCVESSLPLSYLWRHATARERAISMFGKLRVWDTHQNNGVLIYLLLAEHRIEIIADRGLNTLMPPQNWEPILQAMRLRFRKDQIEEGLMEAVNAVDKVLRKHFALRPGEANPNELPDAPVVG
jgi:uncharacterized membrane protein